jgi:hypothetical protein
LKLNSKNKKIAQEIKNLLSCRAGVFMIFFTIHVHWKHVFNFIKDKKISFVFGVILVFFTLVFCVIHRFMGVFWNFSRFLFKFFIKKYVGMYSKRANKWVESTSFRWHVWRHPVAKSGHSSSYLIRNRLPFHMVRHV